MELKDATTEQLHARYAELDEYYFVQYATYDNPPGELTERIFGNDVGRVRDWNNRWAIERELESR